MGCDIHVMILKRQENGEYKRLQLYQESEKTPGEYEPIWSLWERRNYELFSKLAGVRGMEDAIVEPLRGWFEGCPQELVDNYEDYTFSATWFDWCELEALAELKGMTKYNEIRQHNVVQEWMEGIEVVLEAYRVWYPRPGDIIIQVCFDG